MARTSSFESLMTSTLATDPLAGIRVVLVEPKDPVNIAAAVRAIANMGAGALTLVRPRVFEPERIETVAHGTRDIVERIRVCETLDEALADCVRVAGFTARRRAAKWTVRDPREEAGPLLDAARAGPVALLFGREDAGLSNEELDRAHVVITIPTTERASLNLAQAVLVALYELRCAAREAARTLAPPRKDAPPASAEQLERMFADARHALAALDFFRTRNPELVMRTMRSLTFRSGVDAREIDLVRAMAIEVLRTMERIRAERS
jgi:tRNA/rRNA methyltransferase/tRNA (cytidine32/uridine32-2'-O)-methyltransferase